MQTGTIGRRGFLATLAAAMNGTMNAADAPALKIGHRQANMTPQPTPAIFELARKIGGLSGVELQVFMKGYTLWDRDTANTYKKESDRVGMPVPSLSGIWPPGKSIVNPDGAEQCLRKSIALAGMMGSKVILVAAFREKCPKMDDESSYGPVVEVLRRVAPAACDAGVVLGMENSLSAEGNKKWIDLVNHPNVRVFWDFDNVEFYGHKGQSVGGLDLLGSERICEVHCKNEGKLLEEPGRVDWAAAFAGLKRIGYSGWYVFETRHTSQEQCVEATRKNIAFLRSCLA